MKRAAQRLRRSGSHESTDATGGALRRAAAGAKRRETHGGSIWRSARVSYLLSEGGETLWPTHRWRHMSRDPRAGGPFRCQDGAARMAPHVPRYRLWPNSSTWTTRPDHLSDAVGEHDKAFRCGEPRVAGREHERRTLRLIQDIVARREDSRWWDDDGPDYSVIEDAILGREHDPVAFAELV